MHEALAVVQRPTALGQGNLPMEKQTVSVSLETLVSKVSASMKRAHFQTFDYITADGRRGNYNNGATPKVALAALKCDPKPLFDPLNGNFTVYCHTRKGFRSFKATQLVSVSCEGEILIPRF